MTTRKPKASKPASGPRPVTVMGVDVTIDPERFDDWELMESLYLLQKDPERNAFEIVPFLRAILGDQYQTVKDGLRDPETGRVTGTRMGEFVQQLFQQVDPNS